MVNYQQVNSVLVFFRGETDDASYNYRYPVAVKSDVHPTRNEAIISGANVLSEAISECWKKVKEASEEHQLNNIVIHQVLLIHSEIQEVS